MAASIKFYAGEGININELAGSGLGFYGSSGFGTSVSVGSWQGRTFITNSAGTAQGPEADNVRYVSPTGCVLGQTGNPILLKQIPNQLATVNVRFTNDASVKVQNASVKMYNRVSVDVPTSGLTTAIYEVVHLDTIQNANGSGGPGLVTSGGQHAWNIMDATGFTALSITSSPATSGLRPSGANSYDTRHDWYFAVSQSCANIGQKLSALYVSLEFL